MSTFVSRTNPVTGKLDWIVQNDDYDFHQEVARFVYNYYILYCFKCNCLNGLRMLGIIYSSHIKLLCSYLRECIKRPTHLYSWSNSFVVYYARVAKRFILFAASATYGLVPLNKQFTSSIIVLSILRGNET